MPSDNEVEAKARQRGLVIKGNKVSGLTKAGAKYLHKHGVPVVEPITEKEDAERS